jgi:hypothetical protein
MRVIESVAECHMVAAFLRAETESPSFSGGVEQFRQGMRISPRVITDPNLGDIVENQQRALVLGYRGYGRNVGLFAGFPLGVAWARAEMDLPELEAVRYIRDEGWVELSGGTRVASDAVRRITTNGARPSADKIRTIEAELAQGKAFPPLILVGLDGRRPADQLIVLEGHARLTAYLLRPELVSWPLQVIVGYSTGISGWVWF